MAPVTVAVVGGGLAGMTAALRLAQAGCAVTLYESSVRLGGKAGADYDTTDKEYDDHGYHIFPMWYDNAWKLVDELGIRGNFVDCHDFLQLHNDKFPFPDFRALHDAAAFKNVWRNLTAGLLPFHETLLFFYSTVDLASFHLNEGRRLDQLSITGFLRSRFYGTERIANVYQDLMLKAISVPSHFVSAMTTKKVIMFWGNKPLPMHCILNGNLQERFIDPFADKLVKHDVKLRTRWKLERLQVNGNRISGLLFENGEVITADHVVLAIPPDCVARVCDAAVYAACPTLGNLRNLRARPMASLNLHFSDQIQGIPAPHVNLAESRYGLTFIDVSQTWKRRDGSPHYTGSALNVIATDFTELEGVDEVTATQRIVEELQRHIPTIDPSKITRAKMQHHLDAPLFMNDVGIWHFRPDALPKDAAHQIELANLVLAGDYCRSHVDLVSMEGAITTGLKAAESIRLAETQLAHVPPIYVEPPPPNRVPFWLFWALGLPFAAMAKLISMLTPEETPPIRVAPAPPIAPVSIGPAPPAPAAGAHEQP